MRSKRHLVAASLLIVAALISACSNSTNDGAAGDGASSSERFPIELTGGGVEAGKVTYAQNCVSCHGPVQGPAAIDSAPVHGDAGHTWHHPDRLLYQWVLDRPPLATTMPAFRGLLSDEEVVDVLAYIKSSWLPEIQERQNEGSAQYEAQVIEFGLD
ncbi:MAG: cytochrome c [Chloroflexi bacterium]|nr:cytochrome c [Chloroflexota bacterium]